MWQESRWRSVHWASGTRKSDVCFYRRRIRRTGTGSPVPSPDLTSHDPPPPPPSPRPSPPPDRTDSSGCVLVSNPQPRLEGRDRRTVGGVRNLSPVTTHETPPPLLLGIEEHGHVPVARRGPEVVEFAVPLGTRGAGIPSPFPVREWGPPTSRRRPRRALPSLRGLGSVSFTHLKTHVLSRVPPSCRSSSAVGRDGPSSGSPVERTRRSRVCGCPTLSCLSVEFLHKSVSSGVVSLLRVRLLYFWCTFPLPSFHLQ